MPTVENLENIKTLQRKKPTYNSTYEENSYCLMSEVQLAVEAQASPHTPPSPSPKYLVSPLLLLANYLCSRHFHNRPVR